MQSYYALKACLECQLHRQGNRLIIIGVGTLYYVLCTAAVWSTGTLCALGGVSFLSGCSFRRFKDVCLRCFLEMYVRNKNTHKLFTHREEYNIDVDYKVAQIIWSLKKVMKDVWVHTDITFVCRLWYLGKICRLIHVWDLWNVRESESQIFFSEEKFTQNRFLVEKAEFDSLYFCSHESICILNWVVFYIYFKIYYSIYKFIFTKQNLINGFSPLWTPFNLELFECLNCLSYISFLLNLLYFILMNIKKKWIINIAV